MASGVRIYKYHYSYKIKNGLPELAWVKKIQDSDSNAFEVMFLTYYRPCVGFINPLLNSNELSECLVQDVFARIWEIRKGWSPRGSLKAYLYKASKNKALDYLKHCKIKQQYLEEASFQPMEYSRSPNELLEEMDFLAAAQTAIEGLPLRGKLVYELHRRDGLTYKEIAEKLGISPKTVESQMSRVLNILRRQLVAYLP
ncbi:MAG: RNA polymerase sigma-70 factor [Balneolales bacterium]